VDRWNPIKKLGSLNIIFKSISRTGHYFLPINQRFKEVLMQSYLHFLLHAQKKTKQKKKTPRTKPIFPAKPTFSLCQAAHTLASNGPHCSWTPARQLPGPFCTKIMYAFHFYLGNVILDSRSKQKLLTCIWGNQGFRQLVIINSVLTWPCGYLARRWHENPAGQSEPVGGSVRIF